MNTLPLNYLAILASVKEPSSYADLNENVTKVSLAPRGPGVGDYMAVLSCNQTVSNRVAANAGWAKKTCRAYSGRKTYSHNLIMTQFGWRVFELRRLMVYRPSKVSESEGRV